MRRKEKEITSREEIDAILSGQNLCHLAMVDDGEPYIIPLTYAYDGNNLFIHSAKEGRKIDVLKKNNRVCFDVCGDFQPASADKVCRKSTKFSSVIGTGHAEFVQDREGVVLALNALMKQTFGPGTWDFVEEKVNNVLIIKIVIDSLSGKRSGK
jgi:nitroimidazol reductase NimA-like FMN-containing flavoprotein (pyridoxamine 5'-phosphate oxidase superfamily)